jgi:hypothetical protein
MAMRGFTEVKKILSARGELLIFTTNLADSAGIAE